MQLEIENGIEVASLECMEALAQRPAWFVIGPLIGLVVVGMAWVMNQRIGALGGYSSVVERVSGRAPSLSWKWWFLFGILAGSLVYRVAAGTSTVHNGYGWLTREFDSDVVVVAALLLGGALIGFGAKTAGGCTSGNGLGGCSAGSTASFVATGTFMGTAIAASFLIRAVTG
jgi:uncharacterized protein